MEKLKETNVINIDGINLNVKVYESNGITDYSVTADAEYDNRETRIDTFVKNTLGGKQHKIVVNEKVVLELQTSLSLDEMGVKPTITSCSDNLSAEQKTALEKLLADFIYAVYEEDFDYYVKGLAIQIIEFMIME